MEETIASIIIPCYNGLSYLPACLGSLQGELRRQDEILLIDNASSDGSPEWVAQNYPAIRLQHNDSNLGFTSACNQAARMAMGDVLIFLNQDTRVAPGWLAGLLKPFEQEPEVGLVTSQVLLMQQPEQIHTCGLNVHFSLLATSRGYLQNAGQYEQSGFVASVSGASFAIRRELWERLGGFDEALFMYSEEVDLSWRANQTGYQSWYAPASKVWHDFSGQPGSHALYYSTRNRLFLLVKNWKGRTLALLLPGLILAELVEWFYLISGGQQVFMVKGKSYRWLIDHRELIRSRRRDSRSSRKRPDWAFLAACNPNITPYRFTSSPISRIILAGLNFFFSINYRLALAIERAFGW